MLNTGCHLTWPVLSLTSETVGSSLAEATRAPANATGCGAVGGGGGGQKAKVNFRSAIAGVATFSELLLRAQLP